MPDFPNVPNVPGVPPVPRNPFAAAQTFALLNRDLLSALGVQQSNRWGLFLNGAAVVEADNVLAFDFKKNWYVADFPLEQGAFESYDKVETPFDARMRFSAGGSNDAIQALIDSVAEIAGTLDLYDVVTPQAVYTSANVVHFDYRRTAVNGAGLVTIDIWLVEVRVTAQAAFQNTKQPSGAGTVNGGTVAAGSPSNGLGAFGIQ